jgi:polyferredoxin
MDVIRDRGSMAREVENGMIENVYRLQIMNTGEEAHRYKIVVSGIDSIALATPDEVSLQGTESRTVPVTVRVMHGKGAPGANGIAFELKAIDDDNLRVKEQASFFVPR